MVWDRVVISEKVVNYLTSLCIFLFSHEILHKYLVANKYSFVVKSNQNNILITFISSKSIV